MGPKFFEEGHKTSWTQPKTSQTEIKSVHIRYGSGPHNVYDKPYQPAQSGNFIKCFPLINKGKKNSTEAPHGILNFQILCVQLQWGFLISCRASFIEHV
jgi:hypothetical protein